MGWFGLGSDTVEKTVDNVLDKDNGLLTQVGSWIGGQQFTDEEQSEANASLVASLSSFVSSTLSENTVRSKTRRRLALAWVYTELFMILSTFITGIFSFFFDAVTLELVKFMWSIPTSDIMFYGTLAVMSFFFGNHIIQGIKNKALPADKK